MSQINSFKYPYKYPFAVKSNFAIIGWMIGDALGSTLEFQNSENAKKIIATYSNFDNGLVGKGPFNLLPGQFTDDTELGLANMFVVHTYGHYNKENVAKEYHNWYNSNPFDIGNTTKAAVSQPNAEKMSLIASSTNLNSMSNGALMRLPGLIAMYSNKDHKDLIEAIKEDVSLTHGNPNMSHIATIYGIMLSHAIKGASGDQVYELGKKYQESPLFTALYYAVDNDANQFYYNGKIYHISETDSEIFGFVGFAIWFLLRCLKNHMCYKSAILYIVGFGGDTDTNACIVGAVMAALYPHTIPYKWIESLMNFSSPQRFKEYPIANPKIWNKWLQ